MRFFEVPFNQFKSMAVRIDAFPCTKAEFFRLIEEGYTPKHPIKFHLKYIQDIFANYYVQEILKHRRSQCLTVGEIGANHSRVLPCLPELSDRLYAIDVYDRSIGGGYTHKPESKEYQIIECLIGESSELIQNQSFDILFSVSVVENVPMAIWDNFWTDQLRILKEGGTAIHLVDFYCDMIGPLPGIVDRIYKSLSVYDETFVFNQSDWAFNSSWCSNDDLTMYQWCKSAPSLSSIRRSHQSCAMVLKISKDQGNS